MGLHEAQQEKAAEQQNRDCVDVVIFRSLELEVKQVSNMGKIDIQTNPWDWMSLKNNQVLKLFSVMSIPKKGYLKYKFSKILLSSFIFRLFPFYFTVI